MLGPLDVLVGIKIKVGLEFLGFFRVTADFVGKKDKFGSDPQKHIQNQAEFDEVKYFLNDKEF